MAAIADLKAAAEGAGATVIGGLLDTAGVQQSSIEAAFLPSDTAMALADNQPTIRYLSSRPAKLADTINLHIDVIANTIIDDATIQSPTALNDGVAFTHSDSAATGPTTTEADGTMIVNSITFTPSSQAYIDAGGMTDGRPAFALYDAGFMMVDGQKDTDLLFNADKTLATVVDEFDGTYTGGYANVGDVLDLAASVAIEKLALGFTYGDHWLTAFLPSDTAFANDLDAATLAFVEWNRDVAQMILANHFVNGTMGYYSEDVTRATAASLDTVGKTMGDASAATIDIADNTNAEIIFTDNAASTPKAAVTASIGAAANRDLYTKNVVVHEIDKVLTTAAQDVVVTDALARTNLNETVTASSTLETLLMAANPLVREAVNDVTFSMKTLLKPSNDAITALGQPTIDYLTNAANQADLDMVLMAHLLNGTVWTDVTVTVKDASDADVICTMGVCVSQTGAETLDTATLGAPLYSAMGVSYDIATVIVPAAVKANIDAALASSSSDSSSDSSSSEESSDSAASVLAISGVATAACAFLLALF